MIQPTGDLHRLMKRQGEAVRQTAVDRILESLASAPKQPKEVVADLEGDVDEQDVREIIKTLIESGQLEPGVDWKLQIVSSPTR